MVPTLQQEAFHIFHVWHCILHSKESKSSSFTVRLLVALIDGNESESSMQGDGDIHGFNTRTTGRTSAPCRAAVAPRELRVISWKKVQLVGAENYSIRQAVSAAFFCKNTQSHLIPQQAQAGISSIIYYWFKVYEYQWENKQEASKILTIITVVLNVHRGVLLHNECVIFSYSTLKSIGQASFIYVVNLRAQLPQVKGGEVSRTYLFHTTKLLNQNSTSAWPWFFFSNTFF